LLASKDNFRTLLAALNQLNARRIAVPQFDPDLLARGHAVHFRCQGGAADRLRVDVMTRLRDLPPFEVLWSRRTTIKDGTGDVFELISLEDLVQAKKTQRSKDWPMIEALLESHYKSLSSEPTPERVSFWLMESRTPERLIDLAARFGEQTRAASIRRPLLSLAFAGDAEALREALDVEMRAEQAKDRAYWAPLRAELEMFRRAERTSRTS